MECYKEVNFNKNEPTEGVKLSPTSLPSVKSTPEIVGIADI